MAARSDAPASAGPDTPAGLGPHARPVALAQAYRLINHGPTVLVGAAHGGRRTVMAAAWNMPLEFDPPKLAVVIDTSTCTRELAEASGRISLMVPCAAQADGVFTLGSRSAREFAAPADKLRAHGINAVDGPHTGAPLVAGCLAWMEGELLRDERTERAHDLFVLQVRAAWADERVFSAGRWRAPEDTDPGLRTLHHLGAGRFVVPGTQVQGRMIAAVALNAAGGSDSP